jgi:type IV secretory pathway VirD2 relaxase
LLCACLLLSVIALPYTFIVVWMLAWRGAGGASGKARPVRPHIQRCAVRLTYLGNRTPGQWRAHGRYLARETATESETAAAGYNRERDGIDVARELEKWQSAGDQRLWKVILSPEFGDRVDLQRLARDLVVQMEKDFGADLEWVAVTHHNTEHPHVHMVIRGVAGAGEPRHDMEEVLRAMQRASDRQRVLALHGVPVSDKRLPLEVSICGSSPRSKVGYSFMARMSNRPTAT